MKRWPSGWLTALALAVCWALSSTLAAPALPLNRGVDLEGWLDAPQFEPLDPGNLKALPAIRAAGFDFVRLLVNPNAFTSARPSDPEPAATLGRVLKAARQSNLRVLVALYDESPQKAEVVSGGRALDTYLVLLERLGGLLNAYDPRWVGLEPLDEPGDCTLTPGAWMQRETQFVTAARRSAPNLTLVLTGACFSDSYSLTQLVPPVDPNLIYEFQFLDPLTFTQQGNPANELWAHFRGVPYPLPKAKLPGILSGILKGIPDAPTRAQVQKEFLSISSDGFDQRNIEAQMTAVSNWAARNSARVLLGSFTVRQSAPRPDRTRWFHDVRAAAEARHFAWAAWSWTSKYGFGLTENGKLPADLKKALGLP
ncbi:glycoside hydrolase family 5 protein (plasmid) [Deinococcus sp. KNUC1210]|uniref:glycoside hydrolase family 5 protein n=1 Tax=Deinococcus sp. KNUC1210 TaxID=2917691 RepID=UPI001EEFB1CA|nr:cellulase family glycosylhydrolase [Deinococcus sp. KNUC1210]ULH17204.1 glycoside hydrolase family 5 protein [Deinococcus sp. KNUC1210]